MDAKVLRAAVSAAIRVTVSTTLIGCGGNVSTDTGRVAASPDEPAVKGTPAKASEPEAKLADPHVSSPRPTPATGGSAPATETPTAGVANGGSSLGGFASTAGAGGDDASAGAPADVCGAAALACLTSLERTTFEAPLSTADRACCDTILAAISLPPHLSAECFDAVDSRFMSGTARARCCHDPSTWQNPACTPWGPPVPPELSRELLLEWSLAA